MKNSRSHEYIAVQQVCPAEQSLKRTNNQTNQEEIDEIVQTSDMAINKEKQDINGVLNSNTIPMNFDQLASSEKLDDKESEYDWWRYFEVFCSEFFGTGLLMAVGCMGTVTGFSSGGISSLQPGLTFGFIVATLIQIFGHISAAHFNPAVTICFYMLGDVTSILQVINYIAAEVLGATAGLIILKILTPLEQQCLCCTLPHDSLNEFQAVGVEFIATVCLILLVCGLTDSRNKDKQDSGPIKFGLLIVALSFAAGPYTGASMNPARSLAPAIVNNTWRAQWVYWLGPLSAGFIVPLFYRTVFCKNINR